MVGYRTPVRGGPQQDELPDHRRPPRDHVHAAPQAQWTSDTRAPQFVRTPSSVVVTQGDNAKFDAKVRHNETYI